MDRREITSRAILFALSLTCCKAEFDVSDTDGTTGEIGTTGDTGSTDTSGFPDLPGETEETGNTETTGSPEPTVPMYGDCVDDDECMAPADRCIVDDQGRGLCTHPCDSLLDCESAPNGTASSACFYDACMLLCQDELTCPVGMECGFPTYVGNPLNNVCVWP